MKKHVLLLLTVVGLGGCYYVNVDNHEVDIQSDYDPEITISTNMDENDTLAVGDSLYFNYSIEIDTGKLYFTELFINYTKIYQSVKSVDTIIIFPDYYVYSGYHNLTLIAYCKSYSGSLADIYNAEYLTESKTFVFNYNLLD